MREIKFRAWDKSEGIMYKDYAEINRYGELVTLGFRFDRCYAPDIVLEQYTGLKDSNGKEIYEGDILEIEVATISNLMFEDDTFEREVVSIEYNDEFMRFEYVSKSGIIGFVGVVRSGVIGNIHKNPELLE